MTSKDRDRVRQEQDTSEARFIANETGISEDQARGLIDLVGLNRPSLIREARILQAAYIPPKR
ncbi:hypothetical protein [Mesorhizobium sp. M1329]|uniref:hypothetical protein n=1 Tax=Mesorhizobium sp. M1329 TaxID=2957083 RepID=UPI00333BCE8A